MRISRGSQAKCSYKVPLSAPETGWQYWACQGEFLWIQILMEKAVLEVENVPPPLQKGIR
ncbi:hypothetical protein [Candidatus Methylacidithermus pantelleriae]|uniref:hypothetical protein n=1 Tax=Candidatus Methylacidithermus pantelleriae TaxID=2744239 RepID=UPI001BD6DAB3|nr:hypothetical protein [Candidatus Methylacidithermus pantelleriae]